MAEFFQLVSLYSEIQLFDISIRSCWGRLHLTIRIIQTTPAPRDYRKPRCVNISPFNGCRKVSPPRWETGQPAPHFRERTRGSEAEEKATCNTDSVTKPLTILYISVSGSDQTGDI